MCNSKRHSTSRIDQSSIIRQTSEKREELLSPHACKSQTSRGRAIPESCCGIRTEFQRDRDRIIHSKSFRRLKHKTQVFIAPSGDHFVTRLTHTLEVAQIARTIARALNLNEDLTEAIALGHDLGHTPFGHIGEDELNLIHSNGFRHSQQSVRLVEQLEKDGNGLNLTWEVRQGIRRHSKPRGDFLDPNLIENLTLEGQVVRISDAVAYLNHDLADSFRAGVINPSQVPECVLSTLGERHSERVNTMVTDIVTNSWMATGQSQSLASETPIITMSNKSRKAINTLREFMFSKVYVPEDLGCEGKAARNIVRLLYYHYKNNPDLIPNEYRNVSEFRSQATLDYIAGMTDQYAIRCAETIQPGIAKVFKSRFLL